MRYSFAWLSWLCSFFAASVLLYFLTAPPLLIAICQKNGGRIPWFFGPVIRVIESDFGGPLVWYFNHVWHAELVLIGGDEGPSWYMVLLYVVMGAALILAVLFPFVRLLRKGKGTEVGRLSPAY